MGNIFTDGQIVATWTIPEEVRQNVWEKRKWGKIALRDYVRKFIGSRADWVVEETMNEHSRLTGTQAVFQKNGTKTTMMLIEPKNNLRHEVHVSRMDENLEEGSILDVMDYQFRYKEKEKNPSPFEKLAKIAKDLPGTHEIIELRVQRYKKTGELQFAPEYVKKDPQFGGLNSMKLFYPVNKNFVFTYGTTYRAKILQTKNTGRTNTQGVLVVVVEVLVID